MPPTPLTSKLLAKSLSKRLANYKISDDIIAKLADRVTIEGLEIRKFNPCIYGICIDYFTDKLPRTDSFFTRTDISRFEVFPYGIIDWDYFHVQVAYHIDELEGKFGGRLG
jgi:hypothetical protein